MEEFIESPVYMRLKAEGQPRKIFIQKSDKATQQYFSWIAVS